MIKNLIVLMFVMSFTNIFGQKLVVIDEFSGKVLNRVTVFANGKSAVSDKTGTIDFKLFKSEDKITFQHTSYVTKVLSYDSIKKNRYLVFLESKLHSLDEITVSSNRFEQSKMEVNAAIEVLNPNIELLSTSPTTADILGNSSHVFVQKSQQGGGSPMIRGFSANRLLIVVDGVRMNNAIYRGGNLQNVISIDPFSLKKAEVLPGPSSVMFGSDAIGGVMNFSTIDSDFLKDENYLFNVGGVCKYSSASKSVTKSFKSTLNTKRVWLGTFVTYSRFGNLNMGSHGNDEYQRPFYVDIIDGVDSVFTNSDPNEQVYSGYTQTNITNKLKLKLTDESHLAYSFYYSSTSDIPRYDRLIQLRYGKPKFAEWHYGPQRWIMHNLKFIDNSSSLLYDNFNITAAYQTYKESRIDRKLNSVKLRERAENVDIYTLNVDMRKNFDKHTFYYGLEGVYNLVNSSAHIKKTDTSLRTNIASRYPDGATYNSMAAYMKYLYRFSNYSNLSLGLRYNHIQSKSTFSNEYYDFQFSEIELSEQNINYSIGYNLTLEDDWRFSAQISTGFRAPNIDDVAKVFDSEPGHVVVPNKDLESEYAYSGEITMERKLNNIAKIGTTLFYTIIDDAMIRTDALFNGKDSIMYDDVKSRVQMITNHGTALSYGINASCELKFNKHWSWNSNITYIKGEDEEGIALRHVPPVYGKSELEYRDGDFVCGINMVANGEIPFSELSNSERSKSYIYATNSDGDPYSPSWYTVDLKFGYSFKKYLSMFLSFDNIFDNRYRPYSSGMVAAGRGINISLKIDL